MKTSFKLIVISFIALTLSFVLCTLSFAEIPKLLNYQGKLTDQQNKPVQDGTYSVTFMIYDVETAGVPLWTETQSISVSKGIFSVLLGGVMPLNLAFDKPYFLEIKVGTEVMSPRQRIASAAYAMRAENADTVLAEKITGVLPIAQGGTGNTAGWEFRLGSFTHTSGAVQNITGVGFKPRLVIFFAARSETCGGDSDSHGFDDGTNAMCTYSLRDDGGHYQSQAITNYSICLSNLDKNSFNKAKITALNPDGFTLTWYSDQLGDLNTIFYLAYK